MWSIACGIAWWQTSRAIDEVFDTQQLLFAKRLAAANLNELTANHALSLPKTKSIIVHGDKGHGDDDALGFAIFNYHGELLLSDNEHGNEFGYRAQTGFIEKPLEGDEDEMWRILYIQSPSQPYTIAVGQECEYRTDRVNAIVTGQLAP